MLIHFSIIAASFIYIVVFMCPVGTWTCHDMLQVPIMGLSALHSLTLWATKKEKRITVTCLWPWRSLITDNNTILILWLQKNIDDHGSAAYLISLSSRGAHSHQSSLSDPPPPRPTKVTMLMWRHFRDNIGHHSTPSACLRDSSLRQWWMD